MGKFFADKFVVLALAMIAVALVEMGWLHSLAPLQTRLSDAMIARRALSSQPDRDIVIIDIDERSLAAMSATVGRWPWPRSLHAELLEGLQRQRPRAIVFDILFSDPDLIRSEQDAYFAEVIRNSGNTYFPILLLPSSDPREGTSLREEGARLGIAPGAHADPTAHAKFVKPLEVMIESGRIGAHNALVDGDGVVRRYPVFHDIRGWKLMSLPARVARNLGYALPQGADIILNWHGHALSYQRYSYADIHADALREQSQLPADTFTGKIIIIGTTATGLHDIRTTPVGGEYPAVEILATAIDNLKNGAPMLPVARWIPVLSGCVLLLALCIAFCRYRYVTYIGAVLAAATLLSLWGSYAALSWRYLLPLLTPLAIAWAYYAIAALMEYLSERKARERAVQTFGRFLDPRVVQLLVERGETTQSLSGKSREISVLFSDIRGFTTLSETCTPEQVVELLNSYFTQQAKVIFEQAGTLDKYIGDAIMAFWGAPARQPDHALRAVAAGLAMSERLEDFRQNANELCRGLEIGIGIHSGPAVVGFIGAANRQDYTAIGDTVNLASRIEGQTKGVCRILVSDRTRELCEQQAGGNCPFRFTDHGSFQVKGRAQSVRLFEPSWKSKEGT